MKKIYPLLISLLILPSTGFAVGKVDIANEFLEKFRKLPDKKKVEALFNKNMLVSNSGETEISSAQVTAALESLPEQWIELCLLVKPLVPEIIQHCSHRLSLEMGMFLAAFKSKPIEEQRAFTLSVHTGKFQFCSDTEEGSEYLKENLTKESDKEPLYTAIRFLQIFPKEAEDDEEEADPCSPLMCKKGSCSQKVRHPHKARSMPSLQKLFGLS